MKAPLLDASTSAIPPLPPDVLADADPEERDAFRDYCVRVGFESGLAAVLGPVLGPAIYASLVNQADKPNAELAPRFSRAVFSKWETRVRRTLGLPLRCPEKGKGARGVNWQKSRAKKADEALTSETQKGLS